jgi:hypothetical protein
MKGSINAAAALAATARSIEREREAVAVDTFLFDSVDITGA